MNKCHIRTAKFQKVALVCNLLIGKVTDFFFGSHLI